MTWLTTHGAAVINDSKTGFTIVINNGTARVQPSSSEGLKGTVHFNLPSPQVASVTTFTNIEVAFSSQSATVTKVALWSANRPLWSQTNLQETSTYSDKVGAKYADKGILLSVDIDFDAPSSSLTFQSVGLQI